MCDDAVNDCLEALKLIPDWLAKSKIIKKTSYCFIQMIIYTILMKIW